MPIWIFLVFIQGIFVSADSTDSSVFVPRRGGYDEKDAYYLNNQYSNDAQYEYHRPHPDHNHNDFGPRPHDNGHEPSVKSELYFLPKPSSKAKTAPSKLEAILPLVKFRCQDREEGYYADLDFDCTVFHFCSTDKVRHTFTCGGDGKFNQKYLVCDYQQSTNCSKAYSEAIEAERRRQQNLNSRVDSEYDELPELIRTKRIGNDFAEPEGFYRWDDKYDPLRFKRSARTRRSPQDSVEDLLAMSSEPFEEIDTSDFAGRVGSYFTDNQWRSTGVNLPNHRRSFSPYQPPRQAIQQSRQALHNFRQDGKTEPNAAPASPPYLDNGSFETQNQRQDFYRPQREVVSQKPTKNRKYIDDDETYGNTFTNYEKTNAYQGNYRPNNPVAQPPIQPKQPFELPQTTEFVQPFAFDNFFNPPEQPKHRLQGPSFSPPKATKQAALQLPDEQIFQTTKAPYLEPQPKKKKQKKRPQYEQYEDDYAPLQTQAEIPKTKEVLHPPRNKQPQYYSLPEYETTHHGETEGYNNPPQIRQDKNKRPTDEIRNPPKANPVRIDDQPYRSTTRPFLPPQPLPANNPVRNASPGVNKVLANAPISTTQPSARHNRPQPTFPQNGPIPTRPWPQSVPPVQTDLPRGNGERYVDTKNDYQKYYNPPANQPRFGDQIPKPESRKPTKSDTPVTKAATNRPSGKERRKDPYTAPADFDTTAQNEDWSPYGKQSTFKDPDSLRVISDIGQEYRGIVSKQQDSFDDSVGEVLEKEVAAVDTAKPRVNNESVHRPKSKKLPGQQNLSQLSWASIFNDAESYESHEEPTNGGFRTSQSTTPQLIEVTESTKRAKKTRPTTTTTPYSEPVSEHLDKGIQDQTTENSKVERLSSYKKRIDSQREQARQRVKTTTTPSSVSDDIPSDQPEVKESEPEPPKLDEEPPKQETSTRVKFPQRSRVRSRSSTEKPPEVPSVVPDEKTEIPHTEAEVSTSTTSTVSPRKAFDLNKYRSNKVVFPKLRKKEEDTSNTEPEQRSQKDPDVETSKGPGDESDAEEPSKRRPGRKRMGGYRRRVSTTTESFLGEHEQEASPHIEEIIEPPKEKKYIRREFRPKVPKIKEPSDDEEDQKLERSLTTSTEPIKEEAEPEMEAENRSDDEDSVQEVPDFAVKKVEEERKSTTLETTVETVNGTSPTVTIESNLRKTEDDTADADEEERSQKDADNKDEKESGHSEEKHVDPTPKSSEVHTQESEGIKNTSQSDFSTSETTKSEENKTPTVFKASLEVETAATPELEQSSEEQEHGTNESVEGSDQKEEASNENALRRTDLDTEATSDSAAKENSSEENTSHIRDSSDDSNSSFVKHQRKPFAATKSPKYVTMATHNPILPLEELLPLLPRDNGRGM